MYIDFGDRSANGSMTITARALEDAADASSASDYQPASMAFLSAGAIWVVIVVCFILLILLQYKREREYLIASGRGQDVDWTASLTRSILVSSDVSAKSDADINIRKSSMLDARYNFQTIFLALVQASISMAILGGIQLNFGATIRIVVYAVLAWTILIGVIATLWMSYVSETIGENAFDDVNGNATGSNSRRQKLSRQPASTPTDTVLHNLKHELHGNPLLFAKNFVEMSFFKPLINTSQLVAGDIYQDIGRDGSRTLLLGLGQIILLSMYAFNVVDDGKPDLSSQRLYSFYCCGIFIQIAYMSGQDVLLKSIHSHFSFWGNALRAARMNNTYCWEPPSYLMYHRPHMVLTSGSVRGFGNEATIRLSNSLFLWLRFLCSTIINVGGLNIITLLLPLQLASNDDPLHFVMASVGAYYILGIDDYGEPIRYNLVMQNDVPVGNNMASHTGRSEDGGGFSGRVEMTTIEKPEQRQGAEPFSSNDGRAAHRSTGTGSHGTDYRHMT